MLEINLFVDGKIERVKTKDEIVNLIGTVQKTVASIKAATDEIEVEYCKDGEDKARYTLHIVDGCSDQRKLAKYAAFIVPHGR